MPLEKQPLETAEGQGLPTVRQLSVFLENRVGQLLRVTQVLDAADIRLLAFSIIDSVECAVVRILIDQPEEGIKALKEAGFALSVAELVVVELPQGKHGLRSIWSVLLSSEVNIAYAYPLLPGRVGMALAMSVDNIEFAIDTLQQRKFEVLSERDLQGES